MSGILLDLSRFTNGITMSQEQKNARRDLALVIVSALGAALCLYQWVALYSLRTAGTAPGCAVNESIDCAVVWNAPLSLQVQQLTGLPFPAWGLAWCFAVIGLTLPRIIRPTAQHGNRTMALRALASASSAICIGLLAYTVAITVLCPTCLLFYVVVAVVTYLAWTRRDSSPRDPLLALLQTGGWMAGAVILLVYPGMQTPLNSVTQALPTAASSGPATQTPSAAPEQMDALQNLFSTLSPEIRQLLSDALAEHRSAPLQPRPSDTRRVSFGDSTSPVHIVEWVDLMCPHCRELHGAFDELMSLAPTGWHLETRFFPLDGVCNSGIQRRTPDGTRCLAAKMLICLGESDRPAERRLRNDMFANQAKLNPEMVWNLAAQYASDTGALRSCIDSPQTINQLTEDIAYANSHGIEGTPFTVINGRAAPAIPAVLYTLILTAGNLNHPTLQTLPPPRPMRR